MAELRSLFVLIKAVAVGLVVQGDDLFRRVIAHDVVDRIEDEAAARLEDLHVAPHVCADVLQRAPGQNLLAVHAAAPEGDLVAEI